MAEPGKDRTNYRSRPRSVTHARALRRNMTDAEFLLWAKLRRRQIRNLEFRKQVPIWPYIADFACLPLKLVIEVDGGQHDAPREQDAADRVAGDTGLSLLRFWNNDVLGNIAGVLEEIVRVIDELLARPNAGS